MPIIKYKKILEQILRKPIFTPQDMRSEGVSKNYSKKLLFALAKSGKIKRVERGKYTALEDPLAFAPYITSPSYLALWTALSIRNLTTQIPAAVEVVTSRPRFRRKINFGGTPIIFYTVRPKLMFGYENIIWRQNIRIPVATREKIIIDGLYMGGIPEEEILELVKRSDLSLLKRYARLTSNARIVHKVKEVIACSQKKR